jgi:predicted double-glycine peptidase
MVAQPGDADCGPAALSTALTRWNASPAPDAWRPRPGETRNRDGFSARTLRDEARRAGFQSFVFEGTFADLAAETHAGHPVIVGIVHVESGRARAHFVVVVGHDEGERHWLLADPALGVRPIASDELRTEWGHAGWMTLVIFPAAGEIGQNPNPQTSVSARGP